MSKNLQLPRKDGNPKRCRNVVFRGSHTPCFFSYSYSEHVFHWVALYCEVNTSLLLPWMMGTHQHDAPFKWATLPELKTVLAKRECHFYISSEVPFNNTLVSLPNPLFPSVLYRTSGSNSCFKDSGTRLWTRGKAKVLTVPFKQTIMLN